MYIMWRVEIVNKYVYGYVKCYDYIGYAADILRYLYLCCYGCFHVYSFEWK